VTDVPAATGTPQQGAGTVRTGRSGSTGDLLLRLGGLVVATLAAALSALVEAFLVPLRVGGVPVPLSPVLAVAGNVLLVRFAARVTGSRLAVLGPTLAWFWVVLALAGRTTEGDLVVPGTLVGGALLLGGAAALAGAVLLTGVAGGRGRTAHGAVPGPPTIAAGARPGAAPGAPPPVTALPRHPRP